MNIITRIIASMTALITGFTFLLTAAFQAGTGLGFDKKETVDLTSNFLAGSEAFIDEAVADKWSVGFGKNELTPDDYDEENYYLGGYLKFPAQNAEGVIDELWVKAVVLDDNSGRGAIAFAWIDAIGLMNNDVKLIREKLADIIGAEGIVSVNVGVTHTHTAVDTQGIWGTLPETGKNEKYMDALVEKTADAIRTAYETRSEGTLLYASGNYKNFFTDGRSPRSYDENIHLFRFVPDDSSKREILISNFGAHPVYIEWANTKISADYPFYLDKAVQEKYDADFIFIQGAVGGAIHGNLGESNGITGETDVEKITQYGEKLADAFGELMAKAQPVKPILNVAHRQVEVEVDNFVFRLVARAGITSAIGYSDHGTIKMTTEIGYAEIGENIKILMMPGEAFPEIIYGGFTTAETSFNGTDYPYPALETLFGEDDDVLTFGLCNDAIGYIVPDQDYNAKESHELISVGPKAASTLSGAFIELIEEVK
ncbi:MAG: neutral/alkaline non-lysosomal ceramidase N-terminal domain-containing protein [Clostridia bacterium]|nr:neutral/alkaline non-lysosomal ceramidase N-terminal domain-containing protein [Clostridia bacterium]